MDKGSQMDKDWTPQPFTIWSRSEMDKDWTPPTHDLERLQMDKDWTPQPSRFAILVRLRTAPNREGLGGPILGVQSLSIWKPLQIVKGWGVQPFSIWEQIGRQPNVNGTFCKQNLVTENQLAASWKGTPAKS